MRGVGAVVMSVSRVMSRRCRRRLAGRTVLRSRRASPAAVLLGLSGRCQMRWAGNNPVRFRSPIDVDRLECPAAVEYLLEERLRSASIKSPTMPRCVSAMNCPSPTTTRPNWPSRPDEPSARLRAGHARYPVGPRQTHWSYRQARRLRPCPVGARQSEGIPAARADRQDASRRLATEATIENAQDASGRVALEASASSAINRALADGLAASVPKRTMLPSGEPCPAKLMTVISSFCAADNVARIALDVGHARTLTENHRSQVAE